MMVLTVLLGAVAIPESLSGGENRSGIYSAQDFRPISVEPISLHGGPHFFLDDVLIESSSNLIRRVNRPKRDPKIPNPLVTGREDGCFQPYLSVLRDRESGRFRLWYGVRTEDFNPGASHIGYLESLDGIVWLRPHRVLDDPAAIQFGVSVLDDGSGGPDPRQRFKYGWYHGNGLRIATSPDGLHWKMLTSQVVLAHNHDINSIFRDVLRGRYVATVSSYVSGPTWAGLRRVTLQSTSTNLLDWCEPWFVVTPDDRLDEGQTQFYAMDGYLRRGEMLIGMVKVLRDDLQADSPPNPADAYGIGYTALAWSHDGDYWLRDREEFFDRAPQADAWDHAHAWIDEQVAVGDEVFLYYAGYRRGHKVNRFEERQIGLVKMRQDRYVGRAAGPSVGILRTPRVRLIGDAMFLNVDACAGEVRVQVVGLDGRPVRGFAKDDCRPIQTDVLAAPVHWKRPLSMLHGKPVRLEFYLRNAQLYTFGLSPP